MRRNYQEFFERKKNAKAASKHKTNFFIKKGFQVLSNLKKDSFSAKSISGCSEMTTELKHLNLLLKSISFSL